MGKLNGSLEEVSLNRAGSPVPASKYKLDLVGVY
jgi:hypothetical protein